MPVVLKLMCVLIAFWMRVSYLNETKSESKMKDRWWKSRWWRILKLSVKRTGTKSGLKNYMEPEKEEADREREREKRQRENREGKREERRETERKRRRQNKEPLMKQTKRIKILSAAFAFNKWPANKKRDWISRVDSWWYGDEWCNRLCICYALVREHSRLKLMRKYRTKYKKSKGKTKPI